MKIIIETNRLILRELNANDSLNFYLLNENPNVIRFTGDKAFTNENEALQFLENYTDYQLHGYGRWAAVEKSSNIFLGWCGLKYHPETQETDLGFRFFEEFWNKGFATESAKACLKFGFDELDLNRIIGRAMKDNLASVKVLEKIGMSFVKDFDFDGQHGVVFEIKKTY